MTTEELLMPRYKVIAPYPCSPYKVGDIIAPGENQTNVAASENYQYAFFMPIKAMDEMPNIFHPLPWWSDRRLHELPEYVKCIKTPDQRIMPGMVLKMAWCNENWGNDHVHTVVLDTNCYVPATREEYEAFKQQKEG